MRSFLPALLVLVTTLSQAVAQSCSIIYPQDPVEIHASDSGVVYFLTRSNQLWRIQGTGTQLLRDFGPVTSRVYWANFFSHWNGPKEIVLFSADTATEGSELWVTDGTPAGTKLVKDTFPGPTAGYPENFIAMNGRIYFAAGSHVGRALATTCISAASTPPGS